MACSGLEVMSPSVPSICKCPHAEAEDVAGGISALAQVSKCANFGKLALKCIALCLDEHPHCLVGPCLLHCSSPLLPHKARLPSGLQWDVGEDPGPLQPCVTAHVRLLLALIWIPALSTFGSLESLFCTTCLALVTLNCTSINLRGSCSLLLLLYSVMLCSLYGNPSHMWCIVRLFWTFLSKVSNAENGDRRGGGHRTLGRTLTHALNFPAGLAHRFQPGKQLSVA